MKLNNAINVIDTNAVGHPVRIITGGIPHLYGNTMLEKINYMRDHYDWIRTATIFEPRGYHGMMGAVITSPTNEKDHFGIFYFEGTKYVPISGVCTISVARTLVETGMVPAVEPVTEVRLDTANGSVKLFVQIENGEATEATFENEASFVYDTGCKLSVPDLGTVTYDVIYGAYWYAWVDVEPLGLRARFSHREQLIEAGKKIIDALRDVDIQHPIHKHMGTRGKWNMGFYERAKDSDGAYRSQIIYGAGMLDRSPCGTCTCGMIAWLHAKGEIGLNDQMVNKNILGAQLKGKALKEVKVGDFNGVVPHITGRAFITGFDQLILENDDIFKHGWGEDGTGLAL